MPEITAAIQKGGLALVVIIDVHGAAIDVYGTGTTVEAIVGAAEQEVCHVSGSDKAALPADIDV